MSKRKPLGSVFEAIERDLAAIGAAAGRAGTEEVGEFLDVSRFAPTRWMDPDSDSNLSLQRAGQIVAHYRVRAMAEWLADKAGCDLVEREPAAAPAISEAMSSLGRCVQDLADGEISEADRIDLRAAISLLQGLLEDRGVRVVHTGRGARS